MKAKIALLALLVCLPSWGADLDIDVLNPINQVVRTWHWRGDISCKISDNKVKLEFKDASHAGNLKAEFILPPAGKESVGTLPTGATLEGSPFKITEESGISFSMAPRQRNLPESKCAVAADSVSDPDSIRFAFSCRRLRESKRELSLQLNVNIHSADLKCSKAND